MRPGFPSPPVSVTQAPGPHRILRMHEPGQILSACIDRQARLYQWDSVNIAAVAGELS